MASDATKSHIFQQLFSIKILTKLSYWVYIFFGAILKYCSNAKKAVFAEVGTVYPYQICKKNEKIRSGSPIAPQIEKIRFFCERLAELQSVCVCLLCVCVWYSYFLIENNC